MNNWFNTTLSQITMVMTTFDSDNVTVMCDLQRNSLSEM